LTKLLKMKDKEFSRADAEKELANVLTKEEVQQTKDFIVFHTGNMEISYAKMRPVIEREAYDKKLTAEIPKFFTELKARAQPNLLLKGPPTTNELIEAARQEIQEIQQTGGIQPGSMPPRKP